MAGGPRPQPLLDRLWERTEVEGDCWLWKGKHMRSGYGQIQVGSRTDGSRRTELTHRAAYAEVVGPIPDGLQLDHQCEMPACWRPEHLRTATPRENTLRSRIGIAAVNARKTHCMQGHEFTPDNTYMTPDGKRVCISCRRETQRRWRSSLVRA